MAGTARPTVSFLFSGGVFRGVFQLGVLNALSEARLRPDVVAGASVGSITAAMVARTFLAAGADSAARLLGRQRHIRRLAGAYLTLDRLVLTDRFADFIRAITVRAAQTRFSLRDADRVFRRYDQAGLQRFDRELRTVVAGLERLTYISPFELKELIDAIRRQRSGQVFHFLRLYFQEWLDRAGVGTEVLGAEPLERLITDYVLEGLGARGHPAATPFRAFVDGKIFFLATATNLTDGGLEILGEEQLEDPESGLTVLHGLLASSAFPGVFRPRWLSEFRSDTRRRRQYIDGGVIDNLPADAVAQFLHRAARGGVVAPRPAAAPHLVFCASLEPALDRGVNVAELRDDWPALVRRAGQLAYNEKLEIFARTQRNVRAVINARAERPLGDDDWTPLDLEVVSVIPRWLCGTFAFHPMLGFRRERQAASIAHGCAATLVTLARAAPDDARARAWGIDRTRLPQLAHGGSGAVFPAPQRPDRAGDCWFRPAVPCPFSREAQATNGPPADPEVGAMIADIYARCGRAETHALG
jgi:predicted acylesterase/phospholipase RssA